MHAVRNGNLCTKDCLCLYVCPTGATDTETGQIDAAKCLSGCRVCVDACPSHAISLVPEGFPPQQKKKDSVVKALLELSKSKTKQALIASEIAKTTEDPVIRQLANALAESNKLMAEDFLRESGYMLPQSQNVRDFLQSILDSVDFDDLPADAVKKLIAIL